MKTKFFLYFFVLGLLLKFARVANAAPPTIDYQPQSHKVILYQQAAFGVIASGTPPLSYQWLKNGAPIPNATNDQIVISQSQFSDEGFYSIVVSNGEGDVTSTNVELRIKLPRTGDVDFSFVRSGQVGLQVRATSIQADGKILLAGRFDGTGDAAVQGAVLRIYADGTSDYAFLNQVTNVNGTIFSMAIQSDGKILIGGNFTEINGNICNRLARLNPNGTIDYTFMGGLSGVTYHNYSLVGEVDSIAVQSDEKILISGDFNRINGISRTNIARLNSDGSLDDSFQADAPGQVYVVAPLDNSRMLVAGIFATVNGIRTPIIARLNPDGSPDVDFQAIKFKAQGGHYGPRSISVQGDGKLIIGGSFETDLGSHTNLVRLNADGSLDESFQGDIIGAVSAIALQSDGKVIVAGTFQAVNGVNRTNLARLNNDGSLDVDFQPSGGTSPYLETVYDVAADNDGKILIVGDLETVNGVIRHGIARLNSDGSLDSNFADSPLPIVDSSVDSFALQPNQKVIVGGDFVTINGIPRKHLARLNGNGNPDETFVTAVNGSVAVVMLQDDGKVLIAGSFSTVDGVNRNRIARVNSDGSLDKDFQNGMSGVSGGPVYAVTRQSDGKMLIAGSFDAVNDVSRTNIARLDLDGSLDTGFQGSYGTLIGPEILYSVVVQSDGKIVAGGYSGIARFESDGLRDTNFHGIDVDRETTFNGSPYWTSATISSITPTPDDKLLVCGDFDTVDGIERHCLARLNTDGTLDNEYVTDVADSFSRTFISSMLLEGDKKLLIGGYFFVSNHINPANLPF